MIISLISQKGGVGKSALARLLAVEVARARWAVKIADLDPGPAPVPDVHQRAEGVEAHCVDVREDRWKWIRRSAFHKRAYCFRLCRVMPFPPRCSEPVEIVPVMRCLTPLLAFSSMVRRVE